MRLVRMFGLLLSTCILFFAASVHAQEVFYNHYTGEEISQEEGRLSIPTPVDFYAIETPLTVRLESDFAHLTANKMEAEYQPAVLHVRFSDSISMRCNVRIRPRGKSRLKYCSVPPLKIDFTQSGLQATSLRMLEKVKLVTKCREDYWYEDYVLKEYITYKLHNEITPLSFRARLARIYFRDTGTEGLAWENYGFILEETDAVGRREGLVEHEENVQLLKRVQPEHALQLSMFQFMIGNTDWHLPIGHNLKYFVAPEVEDGPVWVVPYDFDLSGIVQAVYAAPRGELEQKSVKDRKFVSFTPSEAGLQEVIAHFKEREATLYRIVEDFEYLKKKDRKKILKYLESFFEILDDPEESHQRFINECIAYDWQ